MWPPTSGTAAERSMPNSRAIGTAAASAGGGASRPFRTQFLSPRPARPLHRRRPSAGASLRRRSRAHSAGRDARRAARDFRHAARADHRKALRALARASARLALRPRHSALAISRAARRFARRHRRRAETARRAARLRLSDPRQLFRLAGVRAPLCARPDAPLPPYLERENFEALRARADRVRCITSR